MRRFVHALATAMFCIAVATTTVSYAQSVPALKARVNDYAEVLTPEQENQIEAKLAAFETLPDKPQVVILTVPNTEGTAIEDYSIKVARTWKIGQKDLDNGVLITVATHPEDSTAFAARIEIGYGLEGTIPDIKARAVYEATMRPYFKEAGKEDYFTAFSGAADALYAIMTDGTTGIESIDNPSSDSETLINGIGVIAMLFFFIVALHWIVGVIFGGIAGAVAGVSMSLAFLPFLLAIITGCVIGFFAHFVVRAILEASGDGGYGGGFGGGGFSGGFGGGGGGFGGGGFSGGR